METAKKPANRWVALLTMAFATSGMSSLMYMRWTFYDPLLAATGLTNTEFAITMSVLGFTAMVFYVPGGWLADKFSPRMLLTITFIGCGLLGFYYATFPGFAMQIVIFALWGCLSTLTHWSALMKATRMLGTSSEQGKMFGLMEGARGLSMTIFAFLTVFALGLLGESFAGVQGIIIAFAVLNIAGGIISWIVLKDVSRDPEDASNKFDWKQVGGLLKMPALWLLAIIVISCYSVFVGATYLTPYFTTALGASVTLAGIFAIFRNYVLMLVGGPLGGFIATKLKSSSKVTLICFAIMAAGLIILVLIPAAPSMAVAVVVLALVISLAMFIMRGIYFAIVDEMGVPLAVTGTTVGIVSMIGFTPDLYMNLIAGIFLDTFPGAAGYQYIFIILAGFAVFGLAATVILRGVIKRSKARKEAEGQEVQNA